MSRPRPIAYRRLASPLHATRAGVGAAWAASLCAASLLVDDPRATACLLLAVLFAGLAAGVAGQVARALRIALLVAVPIVLVNVLVSREGLTVFARLGSLGPLGQGELTVEAAAYGGVIALRVVALILITTLATLTVDPDQLLRVLRRLSFRSALTASLTLRMIPVLAADARRLAEAQRTRPQAPRAGLRSQARLLEAVIGGSLDRALDVAATLELRGFAGASRAPRLHRPWSRHDLAFAGSAACMLALALLGRLSGALAFRAYPSLMIASGPRGPLICSAMLAAALLPFWDRRGIQP